MTHRFRHFDGAEPAAPNERWRIDFVVLGGEGRLVVVDEFIGERVAEEVCTRTGAAVVRALVAAAASRGVPREVVGDMAAEFMSDDVRQWASENRVAWTCRPRQTGRRR